MRVSLANNDARGLFHVYRHIWAREAGSCICEEMSAGNQKVVRTCHMSSRCVGISPCTSDVTDCLLVVRPRRTPEDDARTLATLHRFSTCRLAHSFASFPSCADVFHSTENNQFQNAVCDYQRKCITKLNVNLKSMLAMSCRTRERKIGL